MLIVKTQRKREEVGHAAGTCVDALGNIRSSQVTKDFGPHNKEFGLLSNRGVKFKQRMAVMDL